MMKPRMIRPILIAAIAAAAVAGLGPIGAADAAYKEVSVSDGGVITGKVALGGAKPEEASFTIAKNPEVCGTGSRVVPLVRTNGGGLLDAVVFLDKVKAGKAFPKDFGTLTIDQKSCEFLPYLSIMRNEGTLEAKNSDPVLHNMHTYELIGRARRTVFNVSQPDMGVVSKKVKLRKGAGMKVECDAHDFMHAFVFVARNPYFAVVNDRGEFEIGDVPPGKYTIKVWHGVLGEQKGKAEVSAGGAVTIDFSY